ncbi:MAG TPA: hypothetical protein VHD61_12775 [Lacunisphaera sp.]|nr:hypothetical protein [Lacunisphaera sp.]
MKMPRNFSRAGVLCLLAGAGFAPAAETTHPAPPSAPGQVLFMGTDLMLQYEKKLYRVEDVEGSAFRIKVDGKDVYVPTQRRAIGLHVDADLKLAGLSVQLDELHAAEGYTYGNNPLRKLEEANRNQMVTSDRQDYAVAGIDHSEANLVAVKEMAAHGGFGTPERTEREIATAEAQVRDSYHYSDYSTIAAGSDSSSIGAGAQRMAEAKGQFDAMEVSFKISSPVELKQPYMVILYRFHDPAAKPGVNGLAIHAQALEPIDSTPRYVHVLRGGLPVGFKYVDSEVHIYNRGREVATNLSGKRVNLTRAEAQQYLVMNHVGAHKGATLPPAAVAGTLSLARRDSLTPAQLTRTVYVKVDSDGTLRGAFKDRDCQSPVEDAGLNAALDEVFFAPALEAGKAVEGVARMRLADL